MVPDLDRATGLDSNFDAINPDPLHQCCGAGTETAGTGTAGSASGTGFGFGSNTNCNKTSQIKNEGQLSG